MRDDVDRIGDYIEYRRQGFAELVKAEARRNGRACRFCFGLSEVDKGRHRDGMGRERPRHIQIRTISRTFDIADLLTMNLGYFTMK